MPLLSTQHSHRDMVARVVLLQTRPQSQSLPAKNLAQHSGLSHTKPSFTFESSPEFNAAIDSDASRECFAKCLSKLPVKLQFSLDLVAVVAVVFLFGILFCCGKF